MWSSETAPKPGAAEVSLGLATGAAGVVLLLAPGRLTRRLNDAARPPEIVVRVLGGRYLVQAAFQLLRPEPTTFRASSVVDALHAASLLPVIALMPRYRRAALLSVALAAASVAGNAAIVRAGTR